ncbi:hypothetical protein PR048_002031 [Dryococelus australis]|uniref:Uncharacterized protein n=1 Tax=Dryococelus australis TaxID=614101 RepID=A0ABQ9IJ29_9NEOP|nr:hypothetical protein PR048_002031 [Dryococelus australis]
MVKSGLKQALKEVGEEVLDTEGIEEILARVRSLVRKDGARAAASTVGAEVGESVPFYKILKNIPSEISSYWHHLGGSRKYFVALSALLKLNFCSPQIVYVVVTFRLPELLHPNLCKVREENLDLEQVIKECLQLVSSESILDHFWLKLLEEEQDNTQSMRDFIQDILNNVQIVGCPCSSEEYFTQVVFNNLHLRYCSYFCFASEPATLAQLLQLVTDIECTMMDCSPDQSAKFELKVTKETREKPSSSKYCIICRKNNHMAPDCYHRKSLFTVATAAGRSENVGNREKEKAKTRSWLSQTMGSGTSGHSKNISKEFICFLCKKAGHAVHLGIKP